MQFKPNAPTVVAETIEGETVILHHGTGEYFDGTGSAVLLWSAVERGADDASLSKLLQDTYGIEAGRARDAVIAFLSFLKSHDLIVELPGNAAPAVFPGGQQAAFRTPELAVHTDLADMLLLDPIHDVDEAGWPAPKRAAEAGG